MHFSSAIKNPYCDKLGGASDFDSAEKDSFYIKNSLSEFGFLIAEGKCIFLPEQNLTWIGLVWDMIETEKDLDGRPYLLF
jgi:hypothetical protein